MSMPVLTDSYNLKAEGKTDELWLLLGEGDPIFFATEILGLGLNAFQKRALLALCQFKQLIMVTANQTGKTVVLAIAHIWYNFYKKGFSGSAELIERSRYETLNISPVSRQSKECFKDVDEILHSNFAWEEDGERYINKCKIEWFWERRNENLGRIDFSNNSSFWCLSTGEDRGSGLAGKQFGFISYDECVQSLHLQEELGTRVFSRTAKYSGPIMLTSTPDELAKSQQYWFHLYTEAERALKGEGESDWYLVTGLYDENIFIPEDKRKEFKARLKKLDPLRYRQVVLGEFIASAERMFSPEMVEGIWNEKKESTPSKTGKEYVFLWDWGVSDQGDVTIGLGADVTDLEDVEVIYAYVKQGGDPVELMAMATFLKLTYNGADVVLDTVSMGGEMFRKMLIKLKPIAFGKEKKADGLMYLQFRLRNNIRKDLTEVSETGRGRIKSYYLPGMETQLSSYKLEDKKIKQDWVMVLAMLAWYVEKHRKTTQIRTYPLKLY